MVLRDKPWDEKVKTVQKQGLVAMTAHYAVTRGVPSLWTAPTGAVNNPDDITAPMMLMLPGTMVA